MTKLTDIFEGAACKRLSKVDIKSAASHQHEFNGVASLIRLLGYPDSKRHFDAEAYFVDDSTLGEPTTPSTGTTTWYEARPNTPGRSECRLYYDTSIAPTFQSAHVGDFLFIAQKKTEKPAGPKLVFIVAPAASDAGRLFEWLFSLPPTTNKLKAISAPGTGRPTNIAIEDDLLRSIGAATEEVDESIREIVANAIPGTWPSTIEMSAFARSLSPVTIDPLFAPDQAVIEWTNTEYRLFRAFEEREITTKVEHGFFDDTGQVDVDAFTKAAMSVINRRKARAGQALENHLGHIFSLHEVKHKAQGITEGKKRPDFLFPGTTEYHDPNFPAARLAMLGVKTSLKDRWRQILNEADRVPTKHLFTLQPRISSGQLEEMAAESVRLVVPEGLQEPARTSPGTDIPMSLGEFIGFAKFNENSYPAAPC